MKFFITRYTKGLTLLETLVSITIITLVIIGPLAFVVTSSSYAKKTKDFIAATYLAEEAVELLQNRYDSLYITCNKQPGIEPCVTVSGETVSQIAWRLFKEKFSTGSSYPSCFTSENASGCTFDYIDMDVPLGDFPSRYLPTASDCSVLSGVASSSYYSYVCRGIPSRINGQISNTSFKRVVHMESLPTFEGDPFIEQDNDDLRVTIEVTYRASNGRNNSVKVVRYIHPKL